MTKHKQRRSAKEANSGIASETSPTVGVPYARTNATEDVWSYDPTFITFELANSEQVLQLLGPGIETSKERNREQQAAQQEAQGQVNLGLAAIKCCREALQRRSVDEAMLALANVVHYRNSASALISR